MIYKHIYETIHPTVATALDELADVYLEQRKYEAAQQLLIKAYLFRTQALGQDHPETILTLCEISYVYATLGQRKAATTLYERALPNCMLVLGQEHPLTRTVLDSLTAFYVEQINSCNRAGEEEQNRVLQADTSSQSSDPLCLHNLSNLDTTQTLHKLALVYIAQEKWRQAETVYQHVFASYKRILGRYHPYTVQCLDEVAFLHMQQGNVEKAEATLKQALGLNHPDVAAHLNRLGQLYIAQEEFTQAEPLIERALAIYVDAQEETSIGLIVSLNNLAAAYAGQGFQQRAMLFLQQAYALLEQILGSEHPDMVAVREQYQQLMGLPYL